MENLETENRYLHEGHEDEFGEEDDMPMDEDHPMWRSERITLNSVGIDIGSSTSHLIFSRLTLRRQGIALSSRFVVVNREIIHESPILLTPYIDKTTIDTDKLDEFIHESYRQSGLTPNDIDTGAIIVTGEAAKKKNGKNAPSPSVMIAWSVVRAMERHAPFRRLILEDDRIVEKEDFDLGVAVTLEGDRLATAVIVDANNKDWPEFVKIYNETVDATRGGRIDAMNAPVVITSLGAFGVKAGAPIVVPPSVGTLFVGTAHRELLPNGKKNETAEVITLSLTFDHRVVNGAGAASFVHEIKELIETFRIPTERASAVAAQ